MSDEGGISSVFISIQSKLARVVSKIVPPKDIEDIVQETYVRVCQVEKGTTIYHPKSFLLQTAKNLALDYVKRAEVKLTTSVDGDELNFTEDDRWQDEVYDHVASKKEFASFCEAIRQLPVQCRRVFVLKKVYGYTQKEIASSLNISESTVEKHIAVGMKRCTYFMMSKTEVGFGQHMNACKPQKIKSVYVHKHSLEEVNE